MNKNRSFRTGPHEAHVARQDADELREFVEARAAQESAECPQPLGIRHIDMPKERIIIVTADHGEGLGDDQQAEGMTCGSDRLEALSHGWIPRLDRLEALSHVTGWKHYPTAGSTVQRCLAGGVEDS